MFLFPTAIRTPTGIYEAIVFIQTLLVLVKIGSANFFNSAS